MKTYIMKTYISAFVNEVQQLVPVKIQDIQTLRILIERYESPDWAIQGFMSKQYIPYNLVCMVIKKLVDKVGISITDLEKWRIFEDIRMDYRQWDKDEVIGYPGFGNCDHSSKETIKIENGTLSCYYENDYGCPYIEYALEYNDHYIILDGNSFREAMKKF